MSGARSSNRRIDPGRSPIEEFGEARDKAFKDGDASSILDWVESHRADVAAMDGLVDAWSAAMKKPDGVEDPTALLWPLAALRGELRPNHLERIEEGSARLLEAASPVVWNKREDDLVRAILSLILGDVGGERVSLRGYLESGREYRSFLMANCFALVGTPNFDLVRKHFLDEGGRLVEGAGSRPGLLFKSNEDLAPRYMRPVEARSGPTAKRPTRQKPRTTRPLNAPAGHLLNGADLADAPGVGEQADRERPGGRDASRRESRSEIDLGREGFVNSHRIDPEVRGRKILDDLAAFAKEEPERAIQLGYELVRMAVAELPSRDRPILGLREAARRISEARGIKLSHVQLRNYFLDPEIKIGSPGPDDEPRFSSAECEAFVPPAPKKRGAKSKESAERS